MNFSINRFLLIRQLQENRVVIQHPERNFTTERKTERPIFSLANRLSMEKHHGQLVEYRIRRCGYSISTLASELKINRRSLYNFFQRRELNKSQIIKIGNLIRYDFSKDLPELLSTEDFNFSSDSVRSFSDNDHSFNESRGFTWKDKYVELLEKHHNLLKLYCKQANEQNAK